MKPHPASIPPEGRHRYALRVYYEDTDAGGIVYHATYLRFAERARTEALRDLGISHAELVRQFNLMFVVRRIEVDYLRAARVDDSLVVESEVLTAGAASATLRQTVRGEAGVHVVLTVRLACIGVQAGRDAVRPGRLPPRWRTVLQAMRDARPPEAEMGGARANGADTGGSGGSSS